VKTWTSSALFGRLYLELWHCQISEKAMRSLIEIHYLSLTSRMNARILSTTEDTHAHQGIIHLSPRVFQIGIVLSASYHRKTEPW
jgi:hypothetical protein